MQHYEPAPYDMTPVKKMMAAPRADRHQTPSGPVAYMEPGTMGMGGDIAAAPAPAPAPAPEKWDVGPDSYLYVPGPSPPPFSATPAPKR
jgi:hypothetical protein